MYEHANASHRCFFFFFFLSGSIWGLEWWPNSNYASSIVCWTLHCAPWRKESKREHRVLHDFIMSALHEAVPCIWMRAQYTTSVSRALSREFSEWKLCLVPITFLLMNYLLGSLASCFRYVLFWYNCRICIFLAKHVASFLRCCKCGYHTFIFWLHSYEHCVRSETVAKPKTYCGMITCDIIFPSSMVAHTLVNIKLVSRLHSCSTASMQSAHLLHIALI